MRINNFRQWIEQRLDVLRWRGPTRANAVIRECLNCGKSGKMEVSADKGVWHCWSCDASGGALHLVMAVDGVTFGEAVKALRGAISLFKPRPLNELEEFRQRMECGADLEENKALRLHVPLPKEYLPCFPEGGESAVPEYLVQRRIPTKLLRRYGVGYAVSGPYSGRVIVPVCCAGMTSFVARATWEGAHAKYKNPPLASQGMMLFGVDGLEAGDDVIGVEGVFDKLRMEQYGYKSVAMFGKVLQDGQLWLLRKAAIASLTMLADPGAVADATASARTASAYIPARVASLTRADPDASTVAEVREAIERAETVAGTAAEVTAALLSQLRNPWCA